MSIAVNGLSFSYCTRSVLKDVSFTAGEGQLLAVLGPNGVGKSTLFHCILGFHTKYTGEISLDGENVRTLSPRQLAHKIAYIPQSNTQTFSYTVLDMVLMGTSHMVSMLSAPGKKELAIAHEALEMLEIDRLVGKNFSHLSGGEQQLVLIARALAQQSKTLIMDEPTANLDYGNQIHVLEQVRALTGQGYTVLLSTHNPQHALTYGDMALALLDGRVAAFGKPKEALTAELISDLYDVAVRFVETEDGSMLAPVTRLRDRQKTE